MIAGADAVLHTATLHKPHVGCPTPGRSSWTPTSPARWCCWRRRSTAGVGAFVYTSTTSAFGRALTPARRLSPPPGSPRTSSRGPGTSTGSPRSRPRISASSWRVTTVCRAWSCVHPDSFRSRTTASSCRSGYADDNAKVNELLYRRIDLSDAVAAHVAAAGAGAPARLRPVRGQRHHAVLARRPRRAAAGRPRGRASGSSPAIPSVYERLGWRMFPHIDRVYVNARARADLRLGTPV